VIGPSPPRSGGRCGFKDSGGTWKGAWSGEKAEEIQVDQDERMRLKETELVKMYMRLYKPREMLLITRCETPEDVKKDL
jgi:hypothetical protein